MCRANCTSPTEPTDSPAKSDPGAVICGDHVWIPLRRDIALGRVSWGAMATFMLVYSYVPEMETRRQEYRTAHLKNIEAAHERGLIRFAAAFADPVDGAVLMFEVH